MLFSLRKKRPAEEAADNKDEGRSGRTRMSALYTLEQAVLASGASQPVSLRRKAVPVEQAFRVTEAPRFCEPLG